MSKKRILPALLLAGTVGFVGLHRIYAGRYVTGAIQFLIFAVGAIMLWPQIERMTPEVLQMWKSQDLDQYMDTVQNLQNQLVALKALPAWLLTLSTLWVLWDCALLAARKFKDGAGNRIERWV